MFFTKKNPSFLSSVQVVWVFLLLILLFFISCSPSYSFSITTLSPADNSSGVAVDSNLDITFDASWANSYDTKYVTIYFANGNIFAQEDIGSATYITGDGTTVASYDPPNDLPDNENFYVQVQNGGFQDGGDFSNHESILNTTTWNFSTSDWYDGNWQYRLRLTINGDQVNGDVSNFPIYVDLNDLNGTGFFTNVTDDGRDIRITKNDGNGEVAYELVSIDTSAKTGELHFVANGTLSGSSDTYFYIYYGYNGATAYDNGDTYGSNNVWDSNYVAVYHLHEDPDASAPQMLDSTSNDYDGTADTGMDSSDSVSVKLGKGLDLDGANDDVVLPSGVATDLSTGTEITLSCWFNGSSIQSIVRIQPGGTYVVLGWSTQFIISSDGGTSGVSLGTVADSSLHYVVGSWKKNTTNGFKTYKDGIVSNQKNSGNVNLPSLSGSPRIGSYNSSEEATGKVDEVRISSIQRSAAWINTEYNNQNSPSTFYSIGSQEDSIDTTAPTVSSFSPVDNGTNISITTNLIITFNENIDIQTGNVTIKKASDDSIFETIDVTSGKVTGNGGTAITINPNNGMAYLTSYYVEIDNGAFHDESGNSYAGFTDNGTWNFTTVCNMPSDWYDCDWGSRVQLTINGDLVNGDLSNFPIYVDLSDLSSTNFFTNVTSDGRDIRITKNGGTSSDEVAYELVSLDTANGTGELHFVANGTLSSSEDTDFYIYYGYNGASAYADSDTYGAENVWANNYVGVWHMQEDPDGDVSGAINDSTSYDNDGTPAGSMATEDLLAGKIGNSINFDGSNDYINLPSPSQFGLATSTSEKTITAWIKTSATNASIVGMRPANTVLDLQLGFDGADNSGTGKLSLYIRDDAGAGTTHIHASTAINDNTWQYVSFTRNSSKLLKLFVNATQVSSASDTMTNALTPTSARIGDESYNASITNMNGLIDEFRIANTARATAWISTEYNNQNSPSSFFSIGSEEDKSTVSLLSLSPPDNGTAVILDTNLIMTFDRNIDIQTGNVTIKKASDDSIFETIDVTSGKVTGNGGATITINPNNGFDYLTSYYVEIDNGGFHDDLGNSYAGFTDNGTWNFTTICNMPSDWYDCDWGSRVKLTINGDLVNGDLSNFPIYVDLSDLSSTNFFTNVTSDGRDIRITKNGGTSSDEVAYELVSLDTANGTGELHFIANGTLSGSSDTNFYIYFGYNGATAYSASDTYGAENVWISYNAVWHMEEDPSSTIYDSTSNNNDTTAGASMVSGDQVTGQLGNSTEFDGGSNDYIYASDSDSLEPNNGSLSFWIRFDNKDNVTYPIPLGKSTVNAQYSFVLETDDKFRWRISGSTDVAESTAVSNSTWYHYMGVYDKSATTKYVYRNGSNSGSQSFSGSIPTSSNPFYFGQIGASATYAFDGRLDEVRISSIPFSASWVKTEYNNQNTPSQFYSMGADEYQDLTLLTLSPADNATSIAIDTNLVMTFDRNIDIQTGNVTIKKASDDSIFETIDVTDTGKVSGNGGAAITINPNNGFDYLTSYYVEIDNGAFHDESGNSYAGFTDNGTWNFTTGVSEGGAWYNGDWLYRIKVIIEDEQVNGDLSNFPVYIDFNGFPAHFFTNTLANGADLRVTKNDGSTEVAREVVSIDLTNNLGEMHFVANGTLSSTENGVFYVYYGNSSATNYADSDTYGAENVWVNSYVGVWHMEEDPDSGSILDSTSNSNNGSPQNLSGEDPVAGAIGNALDLDGVDEYVNLGTIVGTKLTIWSLSVWSNPDVVSGSGSDAFVILSNDQSGYNDDALFGIIPETVSYSSNQRYALVHQENTASVRTVSEDDADASVATWYKTDATSSSAELKIYVDGELGDTTSKVGNDLDFNSSATWVGRSPNGSDREWDGIIDEVRISNVARTAAWIKTEYNNQSSASTFYNLGWVETNGAPAIDTLSPPDGDADVGVTENLIITFGEYVRVGSGNITIKKASDDSVFETIDVNSAKLTGSNGSFTFTLNPNNGFAAETDYYVEIDNGTFIDYMDNNFAGFTDNGTWNFGTSIDTSLWTLSHKITIRASKVNGDLYEFPIYVDLSHLPTNFFANVNSDGGDIRVTNGDGLTRVPREVVSIDTANGTGELWFQADFVSATTDTDFYLYYGYSSASEPSASSTYGSQNVWSNGYVAVYHMQEDPNGDPSDAILDSTSYANHGTPSGSMTTADLVSGQIGNSIDFDGSDDQIDINPVTIDFDSTATIQAWAYPHGYPGAGYNPILNAGASFSLERKTPETGISFWTNTYAKSNNDLTLNTWTFVVATHDSSNHQIYINGTSNGSSVAANTPGDPSAMYIARNTATAVSGRWWDGLIDEVRVSNSERSAAWIKTEYNNQSSPETFYLVDNLQALDPWFMSDWSNRIKLTVKSSVVNGDLTDFPVYVRMSDFPSSFFSTIKSDGSDIRVTDSTGQRPLAREIVTIDTVNGTGEMHFKAPSLSSSLNNIFYVYYGNSSAREPNGASELGYQSVWSNGYVAVYHMQEDPSATGALIKDSTSFRNHGTPNGSMTSGDRVGGQLGNGYALDFDGSDDYLDVSTTPALVDDVTISTWIYSNSTSANDYISDFGDGNDFALIKGYQPGYYNVFGGAYPTGNASHSQVPITAATTWDYLEWVKNGTNLYGYLNGSEEKNVTISTGDFSPNAGIRIGRPYAVSAAYFGGRLDEFRISNVARTAAWIKTEYNNQSSPGTFYMLGEAGDQSTESNGNTSYPKIISLYPKNLSDNFPLRANIVITFNKTVTADSGNIIIYDASDDSAFDTIACNGGQVTISSGTVTINPASNFSAGTTYYVNIPSTCFKDASSNYYGGFTDKYILRFTVQGSAGPHPIFFDNML